MAGFTKLFSSIVTSTVWCEDNATLRVWIAMLAMADARGKVEGSVPGFAHLARVTVDEMRRALDILGGPDPDSRTPDNDGRRIEAITGGWRIFNYELYRERDARVRASLDMEGYVYYAGELGSETVKIGFSQNPWARLNDLRVTNPRLEILATERATMAREKDRHLEFRECRTAGEWFTLTPTLKSLIHALGRRHKPATVVKKTATVATEAEAEAEGEAVPLPPASPKPGEAPPQVQKVSGAMEPGPILDTKGPEEVTPTPQDARQAGEDAQEAVLPGLDAQGHPETKERPSPAVSKRFVKPTPEQVDAYAAEVGYHRPNLGPAFCDHYEAGGWKIGTKPMKDWRAAVRTWKHRDASGGGPNGRTDPKKRITGTAGHQPGKYSHL